MNEQQDWEAIERLNVQYEQRFGVSSGLHGLGYWPTPEQVKEMLTRALERGTPLTKEDYPEIPPGQVY